MKTGTGTEKAAAEYRSGQELTEWETSTEMKQCGMGRARLEYLQALQTLVDSKGKTSVVLQDASEPLYADSISAFAADGSACIVRKLNTVFGEVDAAVIRTKDLIYLSTRIGQNIRKQSSPSRPNKGDKE